VALAGFFGGVEGMQFLAGLEAHCFARRDANFGTGSGVASDSGFPGADAEYAEAPQLNAIAGGHGLFETFEDGVDGGFRFGSRQAGPLDDVVHYILLDQCRRPLLEEKLAFGNSAEPEMAFWRDAIGS
jgi:hypothetical protein